MTSASMAIELQKTWLYTAVFIILPLFYFIFNEFTVEYPRPKCMLKTTPVQRMSIRHEYCKTTSTADERRLGGLPAGKISTVWELRVAEDRRRGRRRGEEDRAFQHCMPRSMLPEPPSPVGTGISSAAARSGNRRSRRCCAGVFWGQAFLAVRGRVFWHNPCRSSAV